MKKISKINYRDENIRKFLLALLDIYDSLSEDSIDRFVSIFHFYGFIDAGKVKLSQGTPISKPWKANMLDLIEEGTVKKYYQGTKKYQLAGEVDISEKIKKKVKKIPKDKLVKISSQIYQKAVENYHKNSELKVSNEEIDKIIRSS